MTAMPLSTETTPTHRLTFARVLLHLEGLAMFITAVVLYRQFTDYGWLFFAALLLVPDVAMLPYLISKQAGAFGYNLVHTTSTPLILAGLSLLMGWNGGLAVALIWFAHIGMDRTVGYGLKYSTDFKDTHLNRV